MTYYQHLEKLIKSGETLEFSHLSDPALIKDIQKLLSIKNLYAGEIDGIIGPQTTSAFAQFKQALELSHPKLLGPTTAASLLEITEEHKVSEQETSPAPEPKNKGNSLRLPNGVIVFENQYILHKIPLTWGEVTKGCSRIPQDSDVVSNIVEIASIFGIIREKYGSSIAVNSGYRTPEINRQVGGARFSQHIRGAALDICPWDSNLQKLYQICRETPKVTGLGRGMHRGFVHIDCRPGARVVFDYP
ncbi:DUF882 domain-containing protein [Nostoc sp. UHCC 0702]|nr:DUF882 domain-containing protein [Nostoc sp. UHCC 0702]